MSNPADALHAILEPWLKPTDKTIYVAREMQQNGPESNLKKHRFAILLINEIERLLHSTQRRERTIEADNKYLTKLTKIVFAYPHNWQGRSLDLSPKLNDPDDLEYLSSIAERIEDLVPKTSQEERQSIAGYLTELTSLIVEDQTLPAQLRQHMRRLIVEAETCLAEFEIIGDFALQASLDRLATAVLKASKISKSPKPWEEFMARLIYPAAASAIGSAPGVVIGAIAAGT